MTKELALVIRDSLFDIRYFFFGNLLQVMPIYMRRQAMRHFQAVSGH